MADALEEQGVETHLRTTAKTLLTDESGNVTGVMAEDTSGNTYTIAAKSTVLAAGGYAGNAEKIEEYWGLSGLTYMGTIGVVSDVIDAAASVGAALQDMEVIKTTSTVDVTKGILLTGGMLSEGPSLWTPRAAGSVTRRAPSPVSETLSWIWASPMCMRFLTRAWPIRLAMAPLSSSRIS